ncbi:anti-sigma factor domain-containing protein [Pantoea sp. 1.19]|uniref:anti-sigma factor n=1 Tax=Pantoea sp. 1.19 TaxID=1925589 RepID=UPI000948E5A2|nr:anti-sigma factor [Pantoea sp. 1.19]
MKRHDERDSLLAASYALGTLRGPARRRFARRLALSPELQRLVIHWQQVFLAQESSAPRYQPSPGLWARIAQQISPPQAPVRPTVRRWWSGWAVAAVLTALWVWREATPPSLPPLFPVTQLVTTSSQQPAWSVLRQQNRYWITPLQPLTPPDGRVLELWLIADRQPPQSLGVINGQRARIIFLPAGRQAAGMLAITDEPPGGAPAGKPTGRVLYQGGLTPL